MPHFGDGILRGILRFSRAARQSGNAPGEPGGGADVLPFRKAATGGVDNQ
jgi:hypothetical protein